MLVLVETKVIQTNLYVLDVTEDVTKEQIQQRIDSGSPLKDFSQQYEGEKVERLQKLTKEAYFSLFDMIYPNMAGIDETSKLLQISNMDDVLLSNILSEERDEL